MNKYVHTHPQFPRKPYPIPDQNGQSVNPDQNGAKTGDGAAHTYMAYIREYTPHPPRRKDFQLRAVFSFNFIIKSTLRKQATFRNLTTGFPAK